MPKLTIKRNQMERQWANSYMLIIFDEGAFLTRVQTRVRNFLVLVSHTFFGKLISGLHCSPALEAFGLSH